jgi:cytochrome c-type biogenesis protein CcmH/NrfG
MIELKPGDAFSYFSLGLVYYNTGRKEEALKAFEEAIRLDPEYKKLLKP